MMMTGLQVQQAEKILGKDYVISRALTWRTSKYLCSIAGQRDPSKFWACATWDDENRQWRDPTLVFHHLSDLVSYYQGKVQQE